MPTPSFERPTGTTAVQEQAIETPTGGFGRLAERTSVIRYQVRDLHDRSSQLDHRAQLGRLQELTLQRGGLGIQALLRVLALERGFSWRAVSRLVGVSSPTIGKWRRGERASGQHRRKLAEAVALCEILEQCFIDDVASWMEIPLLAGIPITPLDLYESNRLELVLDWASNKETRPTVLLNAFDPNWREERSSSYEVFEAGDGSLSIRVADGPSQA